MTPTCVTRLTWAQLVDYWAGDLPVEQQDAVDEHLIGCELCTAESMRVAAVTEAMRSILPPIVSLELVEKLRQRGLSVLENPIHPGERKEILFPNAVDVLIHRLTSLPLADAVRVDFKLSGEDGGKVLIQVNDVPFDRATGSVMIACMKHYPGPADTVAETRVTDSAGAQTVQVFTILHRFEQAR